MTALLSVTVKVKDPAKLQEYIPQVPATMAPHGGKMVGRGKVTKMLNGEVEHQIEALFEFPSEEALDAWFRSPEYHAIIPLSEEASHMTLAVLSPF